MASQIFIAVVECMLNIQVVSLYSVACEILPNLIHQVRMSLMDIFCLALVVTATKNNVCVYVTSFHFSLVSPEGSDNNKCKRFKKLFNGAIRPEVSQQAFNRFQDH